jgi:hypothetical protein
MRRKRSRVRVWIWRLWFWGVRPYLVPSEMLWSANDPDLPDVAWGWTVLGRGHWGTLAFTELVGGLRLLAVFRGYEQESAGIVLTEDNVKALRESYFRVDRPRGGAAPADDPSLWPIEQGQHVRNFKVG